MYIKDSIRYSLAEIRIAYPTMSIPDGADLSDIGYARIETVVRPDVGNGQRATPGAPEEYEPGKWRETWIVTEVALDEWKQNKLRELAAYRYARETAGITLNGALIKTDLESQAKINGAWSAAQMNPAIVIGWKGANGWIQIPPPEIPAIAMAVANHVQGCFWVERVHAEAIAALETAEAVQAHDITTGWPS